MTGAFTRERRGRFGHRVTQRGKEHVKREAETGVTATGQKPPGATDTRRGKEGVWS